LAGFTWPAVGDIDTGSSSRAGIAIGLAVTAAYRIENGQANIGPLAADAAAGAVPFFLGAIKAVGTIGVVTTLTGNAWPAMGDIHSLASGGAGIAVRVAVTTANGVVLEGAVCRPLPADAFPLAVAERFGAVKAIRAVVIGSASELTAFTTVGNIDTGNRGFAGISVCAAIATAYRINDVGAPIRPRSTDALAVAVTLLLGAVETR